MHRTAQTRILASTVMLLAYAGSARAATLVLDAPDGCVDPGTLEQEIADLVGRPLADVPDVDFRLTITPQRGGRWHLKLEAAERSPGASNPDHVRELDATSCSELGEAAAVAMAVSIRAFAEAAPRPKPQTAAVAPPAPAPPVVTNATPPAAPSPPEWRPALTLSLAGDAGDLPSTGVGVAAGGAVRRRSIRLAVMLGWVPPRETFTSAGTGGHFQLAFAAADGCFAPAWSAWTALGCGGVELGAYWATGLNVPRPESRTAFWRAGRASLGVARALSSSLELVLQATAVVAWARPGFVLNGGTTEVYRPAPVALRIGAGLDFLF